MSLRPGREGARHLSARAARAIRVLSFYLGAVWVFVAVVAVVAGNTLAQPLWHQIPGVRRDTAGVVCFVGSFVLYVLAEALDPRA